MRLFSTEQVSKYHPDKYCDQISDAILDDCLAQDKNGRVAVESMAKGKKVFLCGEITTTAKVDYESVARKVGEKLGYEIDELSVNIDKQSLEIAGGVKNGRDTGAGDQGIMFGYAVKGTDSRLPYGFDLANRIIEVIEDDVARSRVETSSPLFGDAKTQVTVDLDKKKEDSVQKVLISVCHRKSLIDVRAYVKKLLCMYGFDFIKDDMLIVNPAGRWTMGGPIADCGLTGRKIVCDQYGGYIQVGGGAFSGKDPSKVDRTAAYMANQVARDMLEKYGVDSCSVQLAYAIGMKEPMSVHVDALEGKKEIDLTDDVANNYDLTPYGMIEHLCLLDGGFERRSEGCHYRYPFMTKEGADSK